MAVLPIGFDELDLFNRKLDLLAQDAVKIGKFALYDGAKVAADALRDAVDSLNRVTDVEAINTLKKGGQSLISVKQKNGLRNGLGISKMRIKNGTLSVVIGFNGYNTVAGGPYPKGQPNRMIAASCEGGSSKMIAQPFVKPTFEAKRADIIKAMCNTATDMIDEILDS